MSQWTVSEPDRITFDEAVRALNVRIVGGAVNVVAAEGPARLEVTELDGDPLRVTLADGVLTVTYPELDWNDFGERFKSVESVKGVLDSLFRKRRARAVVSLTVPATTEVKVGTVTAEATVSGVRGGTSVHGVAGSTTLVGLDGLIEAKSVSGDVDAQSVAGELRVKTVSGDLTVISGTPASLHANTVGGAVTLDLAGTAPASVKINTVNGDVAVRLPQPADTTVEAGSTNGQFATAFEELTVGGSWGAKKLSGRLGAGTGRLQVTTVSGAISVLRRPEPEDEGPSLVKELSGPAADPELTDEPKGEQE
ncbi:DUF4097 family beta strand repeat-containing protein [Kitasatospora sp. NBC_01287]|uniref:DUF4097 family beta strand repeat-containing protein n=1 Tax=Kitasatospora sp. NBC_01287 TaxID=2903573 RepID=UPI002251A03D|nr:DUF4097 family beta strand repeat-containing protein [Kitasatospora sp. NBC_01287]MCX4746788.1 DUF4097 family beta strand repeat-containing protein [Kitasatospora sp. NBC_01287]